MIGLLASKIAYVTLAVLIGSGEESISNLVYKVGEKVTLTAFPVKKGLKKKLLQILKKCTEDAIIAQNYEIEYEVIDKIVKALFNKDVLYLYLNNDIADKLMSDKLMSTLVENDIPYDEHNISIEDLVSNILSNIYQEIQNDTDLLTIDTNYNIHILSDKFKIMSNNIEEMNINVEAITESDVLRKDNGLNTSNHAYYENFIEVMFLHKETDKPQISLSQLFIMPKYTTYDKDSDPKLIIIDYLDEFINSELIDIKGNLNKNVLFIEGDGGIGKSSLVSFMAYHYHLKTKLGNKLFQNRGLICIRLRDVIPEQKEFPYDDALYGILKYLNVKSLNDLKKQAQNSLIILDGFDELCMVQGMLTNQIQYLNQIFVGLKDYKIIVTTRPHYIQLEALSINYKCILLSHFDKELRGLWIEKYIKVCKITDNLPNIQYIYNIDDNNASGICDTPMSLYMIAAGKIDEDAQSNNWALYHQIFYEELTDTTYNSLFSSKTNISPQHMIAKYKDILYRFSSEIAYNIYKSNNVKSYISDQEILKIVEKMELVNDNSKKIEDICEITRLKNVANKCYAICNYWKTNEQKERVEFYHNNIQDFFLCEKVFYELNDLYKRIEDAEVNEKLEIFIRNYQELFKYAELPEKAVEFIHLRIKYKIHNKEDFFVKKEIEKKYFPIFSQEMLIYGVLFEYKYSSRENVFANMKNIYSNVIKLYSNLYELYTLEDDYLNLWSEVDIINKSGIFRELCEFIKKNLYQTNLKKVNLSRTNLQEANLQKANLYRANLEGTNFERANLKSAFLYGSNLEGANLEEANLEGANLEGANLERVNLTGANLTGANLERANLSRANLEGANLYQTKLSRAELNSTNLKRVNLASANIEGANLSGANLEEANFIR